MAQEILLSPEVAGDIITRLGSLGKWLQALGLIIIIWLLIQITNFFINKKRLKTLITIKEDIERIETKVDKLSKKK